MQVNQDNNFNSEYELHMYASISGLSSAGTLAGVLPSLLHLVISYLSFWYHFRNCIL